MLPNTEKAQIAILYGSEIKDGSYVIDRPCEDIPSACGMAMVFMHNYTMNLAANTNPNFESLRVYCPMKIVSIDDYKTNGYWDIYKKKCYVVFSGDLAEVLKGIEEKRQAEHNQ